jgi:hypothetical protein
MITGDFRGSAFGQMRSWASVLGDNIVALVVGVFALAALLCLAAIDPATWTFQSNEASHLRAELRHCLNMEDAAARVDCYDGVAVQPPPHPPKGANALPEAFGQEQPRALRNPDR